MQLSGLAHGRRSSGELKPKQTTIANSTLARYMSIFSDFFDFGALSLSLGRAKVELLLAAICSLSTSPSLPLLG